MGRIVPGVRSSSTKETARLPRFRMAESLPIPSERFRLCSGLWVSVGITCHTCDSPGFVLGEVPMRVADVGFRLTLEDGRYRAVLQDTPHNLVLDLLCVLGRGRHLHCLVAPTLPRMLDQVAGRRILIDESTYDALATLGRTVEDMGSTAVLVFNVWGFFEKPVNRCVPFFFHTFYRRFEPGI